MAFPLKSSSSKPRIKDLKLHSLLEITKAINNNCSTTELLELFKHILQDQLSIGKLALFSNEGDWKCVLRYGLKDEFRQIDVKKHLLNIKEIGTINFESKSLNKSFEIVIPVYHKSEALAYLLIGDLEDKIEVSPTIKHLPFIQTLTNIIIVAIENKKLAKEKIHQAAIRKELELASQMQTMLFPNKLPNNERLETAAFYLPHQEVGGDYYDFIELNENEIVFCMADVSGKGVSAALLMANFQANLRALIHNTPSLIDLVKELNSKVMSSANGEKFITLFIAKYNMVTKVLTYVNAGHNPPLLSTGNSISPLKIGCVGLGMFDEIARIKEGIVNVTPKSVLFCYTDGVVEVENEKGEDFSMQRLSELLSRNASLPMVSLNELVIEKVEQHKGTMPHIDDITLLSCRIS